MVQTDRGYMRVEHELDDGHWTLAWGCVGAGEDSTTIRSSVKFPIDDPQGRSVLGRLGRDDLLVTIIDAGRGWRLSLAGQTLDQTDPRDLDARGEVVVLVQGSNDGSIAEPTTAPYPRAVADLAARLGAVASIRLQTDTAEILLDCSDWIDDSLWLAWWLKGPLSGTYLDGLPPCEWSDAGPDVLSDIGVVDLELRGSRAIPWWPRWTLRLGEDTIAGSITTAREWPDGVVLIAGRGHQPLD